MPRNTGANLVITGGLPSVTNAVISFSSTGDNDVVAAVAGQTIRVFRIFFISDADTLITFKNGANALTGAMTLFAGAAFVFPWEDEPWFYCTAGNAFIINQTGTAQISGKVEFQQS